MKRLLFVLAILLGIGTIGSAQTKQPTPKKTKVQQVPVKSVTTSTTAKVAPAHSTMAVNPQTKIKKDKTAAKHYKSNKTAAVQVSKEATPVKKKKTHPKKAS